MNALRRTVAALVAAVFVVLLWPSTAFACSVTYGPPTEEPGSGCGGATPAVAAAVAVVGVAAAAVGLTLARLAKNALSMADAAQALQTGLDVDGLRDAMSTLAAARAAGTPAAPGVNTVRDAGHTLDAIRATKDGPVRMLSASGRRIGVIPAPGPSVPMNGKVLSLGEANLTFSLSNLTMGRAAAADLTATAYPAAEPSPETAAALARLGVTPLDNIDARAIPAPLNGVSLFDNIVFTFPHPGNPRATTAMRGQDLIKNFLLSAAQRLAPGGTISLSLASENYLRQWQPLRFADAAGLQLDRVLTFKTGDYPGYDWTSTEPGAGRPDFSHAVTLFFSRP